MPSPMMELPAEIIQMIIQCLSGYSIKQLRLACKTLAELGASSLIDTVYISPREQDMAVFDAVTQHPVLKRSVRHVVYDSAEFFEMQRKQYTQSLIHHFKIQGFDTSFESNAEYRELRGLVYGEAKENGNVIRNLKAFKYRYSHLLFVKSYRQWALSVKEQENVHDEAWFSRARKGLEALGSIHSVAVHNTWDPAVHSTSMGKSPVARAWPCTTIPPVDLPLWPDRYYSALFIAPPRVLQLLNIARKQPSTLMITANSHDEDRQFVYCHSGDLSCSNPGERLQVVQLEYQYSNSSLSHAFLSVMQLLHNAPGLRHLSLRLVDSSMPDTAPPTCFASAFPRAVRFDCLRFLRLEDLKASYRDLAALMFDRLPKLEDLCFGDMQLIDGDWWDILEGLCHRCSLKTFDILGGLFQLNLYGVQRLIIGYGGESTDWKLLKEHTRQFVLYGKRLDPSSDKSADRYLQRIKEWVDGDYGPENCHTNWWIPDQLRDELRMENEEFDNSSYFGTRLLS